MVSKLSEIASSLPFLGASQGSPQAPRARRHWSPTPRRRASRSSTCEKRNKAAERLTRHTAGEALLSLDAAGLYCGGTAESVLERLRAAGPVGRVEGLRAEVRSRLGETIPVTLSASLILDGERELAWVAFLVDQRESEKQSMLAELAGAAAHELNQPLTSVLGYADLLRRKVADDDPNFRSVEIIYREAERMAEIVKKIGNVTRYETTTYVGNVKIVDIDKASDP